ncbi:hypothetical protein BOW53_11885 [Solemya pervernicosa gill symbiont]|uniref:Exonuclease domain-containing protein n=2 Tax=Gammaproteobacteria incertae sedis TaxID=118884 RepID=A0A1T2L2P3_9GAMM|nr:3'-5' exonuclease [Candidatus Reidiella endopervernicosa]OOZ39349.1 hypothetical protein BOW53_11885 [Solemya pervernicosa gill symbiont]QKQ26516.1 3'-5' exonuclease [Candidatus Reidiella endopervernicosa]
MFDRFLPLDFQRRRLLARTPTGPMHDYLSRPFPASGSDSRKLPMVAIDLETTGLNPQRDEIISIGLVCLNGLSIDLGSSWYCLLRPSREMPEQSAVIHAITDDEAAKGVSLEQAMRELLPRLVGRVMIAHHARFEMQFLSRACQRLYGVAFLSPVVDTLTLAKDWLERRDRVYAAKSLRLAALREHYHLPRYQAHNALSDALAAAELYLAQIAQRDDGQPIALKRLLYRQ